MRKKANQSLPTYDVIIRNQTRAQHIVTTNNIAIARRKYNEELRAGACPRLLIDGKDVPIMEADKLMRVGPTPMRGLLTVPEPKKEREP